MKNRIAIKLFLLPILLGFMITSAVKCTHEDEVLSDIIGTTFEYGTDVISLSDGFTFDVSHSSIQWESPYFGVTALMTGSFKNFNLFIEFDENNPENTELGGWVELSSVNTGDPGRDQGCLLGTFGVAVSDTASFISTLVEKDGKGGYNVTGDMTFHGVTSPITGKLTYTGITNFDEDSGVHGAPLDVVGFEMNFDMLAKSVFGITSGSIADRVGVRCNAIFEKGL